MLSKYGAKSEQLNQAQLALLEVEPGINDLELEGETQLPASPHPR